MHQENFEYGCFYHVFSKGNNSENIFNEEKNFELFFNLMKKYLLPVADIYAYCLMKNHFHLLVRIKDKEEILNEKWKEKPYLGFSHLLNSYAQTINKAYGRTGSLFSERLKRIKITEKDYLIQLIVYIHLNPIKHRFSDTLEYAYSSYNAINSNKPTLLKRKEVLEYFGDIENFISWHDFQKIKREEILKIDDEK
jgi:REP element-mobilizing transposase RayT